jgi:hypothetical protein
MCREEYHRESEQTHNSVIFCSYNYSPPNSQTNVLQDSERGNQLIGRHPKDSPCRGKVRTGGYFLLLLSKTEVTEKRKYQWNGAANKT